jgi:inositol-phosphate phosphatase / L-galactose 1-phosphate phosphatase / histidinol-phosphatase
MDYSVFLDTAHMAADCARYILNEHRQNFRYQQFFLKPKKMKVQ